MDRSIDRQKTVDRLPHVKETCALRIPTKIRREGQMGQDDVANSVEPTVSVDRILTP